MFQKPKLIRAAPASGSERHDQQPLMKTRLLLLLVEAGEYFHLWSFMPVLRNPGA